MEITLKLRKNKKQKLDTSLTVVFKKETTTGRVYSSVSYIFSLSQLPVPVIFTDAAENKINL
jgi:hypothetical protein